MAILQSDLNLFLAGPGDVQITVSRLTYWRAYAALCGAIRHRIGQPRMGELYELVEHMEAEIRGATAGANGVHHG